MRIAIVTDSSADLSEQQALDLGIHVLRMPMVVGDDEYIEEVTISRDSLIQAMIDGKSVITSQPNVYKAHELFNELLKTHDHIILLPISSRLSGSYASFKALEDQFDGKLTVIDTLFVAHPLLYMVKQAKAWADAGVSIEAIKNELENNSRLFAALIPSDIQYLRRGGRIKPAAAAVANLLKIFPVLQVTNGEIDLADKVRTYKRAVSVGINKVLDECPVVDYDFFVINGGCSEEVFNETINKVESKVGKSVAVSELYPIILAHTGPGTIVIGAVKKYKELT